jgi:hypothetical protein
VKVSSLRKLCFHFPSAAIVVFFLFAVLRYFATPRVLVLLLLLTSADQVISSEFAAFIFPPATNRIDDLALLEACVKVNASLAPGGDTKATVTRVPFRLFAPASATSTFAPLTNTIVSHFVLRHLQSGELRYVVGVVWCVAFAYCRCYLFLISVVCAAGDYAWRPGFVVAASTVPAQSTAAAAASADTDEVCWGVRASVCRLYNSCVASFACALALTLIIAVQVHTHAEVRRSARSGRGSNMAELLRTERRRGDAEERKSDQSTWS